MTDKRTLKKIINEQRKKIEKFKLIAVHVVKHCCTDCEDTAMCEYECAITKLKEALDYQQEKEKKMSEGETFETEVKCKRDVREMSDFCKWESWDRFKKTTHKPLSYQQEKENK